MSNSNRPLPEKFKEISEQIHRVAAADSRGRQLGAKTSAESVAQSAIKSALANIKQFNGQSDFEFFAWLKVILERKWLQRIRSLKTQKRDVSREVSGDVSPSRGSDLCSTGLSDGDEPQQNVLDEEMNQKIRSTLEAVSKPNREVLVLRYFYDLSYGEIAEKLDLTVGTISGRLVRGMKEMKDCLGSDLFDD